MSKCYMLEMRASFKVQALDEIAKDCTTDRASRASTKSLADDAIVWNADATWPNVCCEDGYACRISPGSTNGYDWRCYDPRS